MTITYPPPFFFFIVRLTEVKPFSLFFFTSVHVIVVSFSKPLSSACSLPSSFSFSVFPGRYYLCWFLGPPFASLPQFQLTASSMLLPPSTLFPTPALLSQLVPKDVPLFPSPPTEFCLQGLAPFTDNFSPTRLEGFTLIFLLFMNCLRTSGSGNLSPFRTS